MLERRDRVNRIPFRDLSSLPPLYDEVFKELCLCGVDTNEAINIARDVCKAQENESTNLRYNPIILSEPVLKSDIHSSHE